MTRKQFAEIMAYIAAGVEKGPSPETAAVYYAALGDLPLDVFRAAAKVVILNHGFKSFPLAYQLRQAASDIVLGQIAELPPAEAWRLAWEAVGRIDPDIQGPYTVRNHEGVMTEFPSQKVAVIANLPPLVAKTLRAYGLQSMIGGKESVSIVRSQFIKMFEQIAAQHKKLALMPEALAKEIESRATPAIGKIVDAIGVERT